MVPLQSGLGLHRGPPQPNRRAFSRSLWRSRSDEPRASRPILEGDPLMTPTQIDNFRYGADAEAGPPQLLGEAAYHGLAGEVVRRIEPETEADPVALLLIFLVIFGNVIGRSAHFLVSGGRHSGNLFLGLVGATSAGRKGTASSGVMSLFRLVDQDYCDHCVTSTLSSGEGLIQAVRDAVVLTQNDRRERRNIPPDPGVRDKRLLVLEEEFARPLKTMQRLVQLDPQHLGQPVVARRHEGEDEPAHDAGDQA